MRSDVILAPVETVEPIAVGLLLAAPELRFVSEREPGPWICCGPCAAAMVAGYWDPSRPASLAEAHEIRKAIPDDHAGGLSTAELEVGLERRIVVEAFIRRTADQAPTYLGRGHAIAVGLTYGRLPERLRRWQPGFVGGHFVTVAGWRDGIVDWYDPLAPPGWTGEPVEWQAVRPALWSGAAVVTSSDPRRQAMPVPVTQHAPARVRLEAGAELYDAETGQVRVTSLGASAVVERPYMVGTDHAVVITTGGVTQILRARLAELVARYTLEGDSGGELDRWIDAAPPGVTQVTIEIS